MRNLFKHTAPILVSVALTFGTLVATAQVAHANVTVSYSGNGNTGGTAPSSQTQATGTFLTLPTQGTLTRTGHTFADWNTSENGGGITYLAGVTNGYPVTVPQTLYAKWTANRHTLSFDKNDPDAGGLLPADIPATYDTVIHLPAPVGLYKPGYTFVSWQATVSGATVNYNVGTSYRVPDNNVTFYARWTPNQQVIGYDRNMADGGLTPPAVTALTGDVLTMPVNSGAGSLFRNGYYFGGWNTQPDGKGTNYAGGASGFQVPPANFNLFANWIAIAQSIRYHATEATGGTPPVQAAALTGSSYKVDDNTGPTPLTRTGYVLVGWNSKPSRDGIVYPLGGTATVPYNGLDLYPIWQDPKAVKPVETPTTTTSATSAKSTSFFAARSTKLTTAAKKEVATLFNSKIKDKNIKSITVNGFSGPGQTATALSRAKSVASYLKTLGVKTTIKTAAKSTSFKDKRGHRAEIVAVYK